MNALSRTSACFLMLLVALIGGSRASTQEGKGVEPGKEPVALKGFDPVLLTAGKEVKGKPELSAARDGFRYLFTDAGNRAKFDKDPERYAIQFQGHCAIMRGSRADPDIFTVYKERIYAFGCADCKATFLEQPEERTHPVRNVAILIFDGMELLDFAGPAEVFTVTGRGPAFKVHLVASTREPVTSQRLVKMTPVHTLADCPRPDVIVIPGGNVGKLAQDQRVLDWIKQSASQAEIVLSVCTGAFVLANAGLLDGGEATTHWGSIARLREQFPKVTVRENRRFVDNGKIITAAGVSAGIDASLHVVQRLLGEATARQTARYMEYHWQPESAK
jgi:putative intracellular protease/amidase/YHS domain-containing protein